MPQPEMRSADQAVQSPPQPAKNAEPGFDYLDIPAFLRRQAD